jgi:hypothetical protein
MTSAFTIHSLGSASARRKFWCSVVSFGGLLGGLAFLASGCRSAARQDQPAAAKEQATVSAAGSGGALATTKPVARRGTPTGPGLLIYVGKGVGPLRFGAYASTIERLLRAPCDYQTETRCVQLDRALDLTLEDGVLAKIRVESPEHLPKGLGPKELGANGGRTFGAFNGLLEPKIVFGLHKHIVEEEYGMPQSEEQVKLDGPTGLVARTHYPHIIFEYERIGNGNTILTAFEMTPDEPSLQLMKKAKDDLKAKNDLKAKKAAP